MLWSSPASDTKGAKQAGGEAHALLVDIQGGLAQLGEHLLCKQGVVGSIPSSSTTTTRTATLIEIQHQSGLATGCFGVDLASARSIGCSLKIHRVESALLAETAHS